MPFDVERSGGGYKVREGAGGNHPGRTFANHPQTKAKAESQRRAIEANMHGDGHRESYASADNCGTGSGGFQSKNTCGGGQSSAGGSTARPKEPKSKLGKAVEHAHQAVDRYSGSLDHVIETAKRYQESMAKTDAMFDAYEKKWGKPHPSKRKALADRAKFQDEQVGRAERREGREMYCDGSADLTMPMSPPQRGIDQVRTKYANLRKQASSRVTYAEEPKAHDNPFAICTAGVGRDSSKYEDCVREVKKEKGIK